VLSDDVSLIRTNGGATSTRIIAQTGASLIFESHRAISWVEIVSRLKKAKYDCRPLAFILISQADRSRSRGLAK